MKVLVVDDLWVARAGVRHVLSDLDPDVEVVEAENLAGAETAIAANPDLDLVVVDLVADGMGGLDSMSRLHAVRPRTPIVIFSAIADRKSILATIERGAAGFIPKSATGEDILKGLQFVLSGTVYVPRVLIEQNEPSPPIKVGSPPGRVGVESLTERQLEVFEQLGLGKTNDEIADDLRLSKHTVRQHIATIRAKLGAENRTRAVILSRQYLGERHHL